MWTTLALMSALTCTPAQAGQMEVKNVRFTYGALGQSRKESTFLPGDLAVLSFDIEGLKVKEDGYAQYSVGWKLFNHKKNKEVFAKDPEELQVINSLGGSRQPVFIWVPPETYMEPGEYTIKADVKDSLGKIEQKLERKFTVKTKEFGIVNPGLVYNVNRNVGAPAFAPPVAVPGQNLLFHFTTVGFAEGGDKNLPKISVKAEIQDEAGKPVLQKPVTGKADDYASPDSKRLKFIPFQVPIQINRSGKYKIVVTAKDEISGKSASLPAIDLTVLEVK